MVHACAGTESHGGSVACVARSRARNVIDGHAGSCGPVVAGNALLGRSLQPAIDMAGHAFDGHVRARQRKAGFGMIEMRSSLLCQRRNRDRSQN